MIKKKSLELVIKRSEISFARVREYTVKTAPHINCSIPKPFLPKGTRIDLCEQYIHIERSGFSFEIMKRSNKLRHIILYIKKIKTVNPVKDWNVNLMFEDFCHVFGRTGS